MDNKADKEVTRISLDLSSNIAPMSRTMKNSSSKDSLFSSSKDANTFKDIHGKHELTTKINQLKLQVSQFLHSILYLKKPKS